MLDRLLRRLERYDLDAVMMDGWEPAEEVDEESDKEAVDVHVIEGGHEIAISKGALVAQKAMESWTRPVTV